MEDDWKKKSYVLETEEAGKLTIQPYERNDPNGVKETMEGSNVDRLYFVLEERFPGKAVRSVESFDITIGKDEEPQGIIIQKYDKNMQPMPNRDIRFATVTRGMVDGVMFYFEDEWRRVDDQVILEVADKLEEYFKCSEQSSQSQLS